MRRNAIRGGKPDLCGHSCRLVTSDFECTGKYNMLAMEHSSRVSLSADADWAAERIARGDQPVFDANPAFYDRTLKNFSCRPRVLESIVVPVVDTKFFCNRW